MAGSRTFFGYAFMFYGSYATSKWTVEQLTIHNSVLAKVLKSGGAVASFVAMFPIVAAAAGDAAGNSSNNDSTLKAFVKDVVYKTINVASATSMDLLFNALLTEESSVIWLKLFIYLSSLAMGKFAEEGAKGEIPALYNKIKNKLSEYSPI